MMKSMMILAATVFTLVFLYGCGVERVAIDPVGYKTVSQGEEITAEDAAQIVDGETTKDDVYLMFGKPAEVLEDGRVFVYDWIRGGEGNVLGFGTGNAKAHSLIVTFDGENVVSGHNFTRGDIPDDAAGN